MKAPTDTEIVLASASPRRRELLTSLGVPIRVILPQVSEDEYASSDPVDLARKLADAKADSVSRMVPDAVVIAADTIVVHQDTVLGKPRDADHARRMLAALSGKRHRVVTAVAIATRKGSPKTLVDHEVTMVEFKSLRRSEIEAYIASGEYADKAGAYGIQGLASLFVTRIEGCYFNVVGLPLAKLGMMLTEFGIDLLS
ncbi:MAG: septum formation inhibitor Maf [Firmicutes bacterium]|nr:septum formation inhibitor Maf [Bacillota bacterium]